MPVVLAQTTIFGGFEYERFSRDLEPWRLATAELSVKSLKGTVIGRVSEARRFGERGTSLDLDAYPRLTKTTYAYVNVGGSNSSILPHRRYAAEVFHTTPGAWEVSLGAQRLEFNGRSTVYTGSVGKYHGNYWVAVRPRISEIAGERFNGASAVMRRYFATGDDYVGLDAQGGETPPDPLLARETGLARWSAGVQAQHLVGHVLLRARVGLESISLGAGVSRRGTIASAGIGRRF